MRGKTFMAIVVRFKHSTFRLDRSARSAVGRRVLRESAFYPCSPLPMYGNNFASFNGFRRLLHDGASVAQEEPVTFTCSRRLQLCRVYRRLVRATCSRCYRCLRRGTKGCGQLALAGSRIGYRVVQTLGRFGWRVLVAITCEPGSHSSKRVTLVRDPRCGRWHKAEGA